MEFPEKSKFSQPIKIWIHHITIKHQAIIQVVCVELENINESILFWSLLCEALFVNMFTGCSFSLKGKNSPEEFTSSILLNF